MSSRTERAGRRRAPRDDARPQGPSFAKLKPGPGKSPEAVSASQRARIHRAMVELCAEVGYPRVAVRGLLRTSAISSRTFYAHFPNVDECFRSAYRTVVRSALHDLSEIAVRSPDAEQGLRAGLRSLLEQIAADPRPARLALVDAFDAGPATHKEMALTARQLARFLPFDVDPSLARSPLLHSLEQAAVAGVERVVRWRLMEGREAELPALADELADWVVGLGRLDLAALARAGRRNGAAAAVRSPTASWEEIGPGLFKGVPGDRGRVSVAVARLALTDGYWKLDALRVRTEAGLSRRRFASLYQSLDDCFLEVAEALLREAACRIIEAGASERERGPHVHRSVLALCECVARQPQLVRLASIDLLCPGVPGLHARERMLAELAAAVSAERSFALGVEASVAAAWQLVQSQVATGAPKKLTCFAPLIEAVFDGS